MNKIDFKELLTQFTHGFLFFAIVVVAGTLLIKLFIKILTRFLKKSKIDRTIRTFLISVIKVVLYAIVVITALGTIGIDLSSIIATIGAAALTAGLALQDTLKNFVSGMIILISKPFVAGDTLEIGEITGVVESINIFYTKIRSVSDCMVQVPNSQLTDNTVVNCTIDGLRRMKLTYTIDFKDDINRAKALIFDLMKTNELISLDPPATVQVGKYLDNGVEIVVLIWVKAEDYYKVYYFMQENVKKLFDKNDITIPYPHIVVKK